MHFAGDVMLGRRYIEPTLDFTAVVTPGDGGGSARAVVSSIAPLFSAADVRSLNLETVVGDFSLAEAYPRKRFLLQSPPEIIHTLDELDANLVTLGNNHLRDWLDVGVTSTLNHLDAAAIPYVGAGSTEVDAAAFRVVNVAGHSIAFLSMTSVNGSFVNDNLPAAGAPAPPGLSPAEAWQYEERLFGFAGATVTLPDDPRRIGEVWEWIDAQERGGLGANETALLWDSASAVYPELQDWVARRGHGGANPYSRSQMETQIDALELAGHDLIVVQLHAGFQFLDVKSSLVESAAHAAIDAGADLVVCHHPHVLQGFEWYHGRLIAYSLGNFVFDQDFLSTFPSTILRTVFEGDTLIEARLYPVVIDNYRPVALAGPAATRVLRTMEDASVKEFRSERIGGAVRRIARTPVAHTRPPVFVHERNTARLLDVLALPQTFTESVSTGAVTYLDGIELTRSRGPGATPLPGVLFGRDLLGWGSFEDAGADGESRGGHHWVTNTTYKRIEVLPDAPSGVRALRMRRSASNSSTLLARPRARITFSQHRFYADQGGGVASPIDGEPSYSVAFKARMSGAGTPFIRLDVYHFDDTNPTADPESTLLRIREVPFPVPGDDTWNDVLIDLPADTFTELSGLDANSALLYFALDPPETGKTVLLIDDVRVLEWRLADDLPDQFYAVDAVRAATAAAAGEVDLERRATP